jgi:CTP synthase (UTP-ammonia lyase)
MHQTLRTGIIGDYDPELRYHVATNEALDHAAAALSVPLSSSWIPTPSLTEDSTMETLGQFHALWCAPASPYKSMDGALEGIRFAREQGRPFMGASEGGFNMLW